MCGKTQMRDTQHAVFTCLQFTITLHTYQYSSTIYLFTSLHLLALVLKLRTSTVQYCSTEVQLYAICSILEYRILI
jgi:hypothetical protein